MATTEGFLETEITRTSSADVRSALIEGSEITLVDLRPEGEFAAGHPLFAASIPFGLLEKLAVDRIPRLNTRVVLYETSEQISVRALRILQRIGFSNVSILDHGLEGWIQSGGELFEDVNVPSKAFGELVESVAGTPHITPEDLREHLDSKSNIVVLDARRFDEYETMSIPTSTSVPGAELVLRVGTVAPDPETTVVVNCAGRTRSIIGTQSLINAGIPNKVLALRNGTIGWSLAGLELEHGQQRTAPNPSPEAARKAAQLAMVVAEQSNVNLVSSAELLKLVDRADRTTYLYDVRTPEEYSKGHLPGFRSAPGGQLVQETDRFAPVRGASIVVVSGDARAQMTASWLSQMGWESYVVEEAESSKLGEQAQDSRHFGVSLDLRADRDLRTIDAETLALRLHSEGLLMIDVDNSRRYQAGHIPTAKWALRRDLLDLIVSDGCLPDEQHLTTIGLTSLDGKLAAIVASELLRTVSNLAKNLDLVVLEDGTSGWQKSGRELESGTGTGLSPTVDFYRRPYEGTEVPAAAMEAYLQWEYGLVEQLARDGTHRFSVLKVTRSEI